MKRIIKALAAITVVLGLASCSGQNDNADYEGMQGVECESIANGWRQCTATMLDTRRVTCLLTSSGLDCDWTHADGSDNL